MDKAVRKEIAAADSVDALRNIVSVNEASIQTTPDFALVARQIDAINGASTKLAILADFTIDDLAPTVAAKALVACGIAVTGYTGAYSQHHQEVLDPDSGLHEFKPDFIFFAPTLENLAPEIESAFALFADQDLLTQIEEVVDKVAAWVRLALANTTSTLLIGNFEKPGYASMGIADRKRALSETAFYARLNDRLRVEFLDNHRVYVVDIDQVASRVGYNNVRDLRMYYLARMRWAEPMIREVADELSRYVYAVTTGGRKCLVVDLDNTLWGGIVGEDGIDGIRISQGDYVGEAFLDFQKKIKQLKNRGIILAICSKNNLADVEEVFEKNKHMPLSLDDFAVCKINWEPKHQNLVAIAETLNIGVDGLVFVDDSDFEIGLVRNAIPAMKAIRLPSDPAQLPAVIDTLIDFEKPALTAEDRSKSAQYKQHASRNEHKHLVESLDDYLAQLGTVLTFNIDECQHQGRILQLASKTNQFNLTTIRYTAAQIENMLSESNWTVITVHAADIHGELGIIGAAFINLTADTARIDNIVISCRALGRRIETALMNFVKSVVFAVSGIDHLCGDFIRTAKNGPANGYFLKQGFEVVRDDGSGRCEYLINRENTQWGDVAGIEIVWKGENIGKETG